jgi:hypothetical protein
MEEKIEREKPHAHLTFLSLFSLFHSFVFFVETKSNILPKIKGKKKEREGGREVHNHSISRESVKKGGPSCRNR